MQSGGRGVVSRQRAESETARVSILPGTKAFGVAAVAASASAAERSSPPDPSHGNRTSNSQLLVTMPVM